MLSLLAILLILEKRASNIFKLYGNFIRAKGEYDDPARLGRGSLLSYLIPIGAFILSPITTSILHRKSGEKRLLMIPESARFLYAFALLTVC